MPTKRVFKHSAPQTDATAFVDAAPYSSGKSESAVKTSSGSGVDAQLHVLMPRADIVMLKRAALDRGTTVSDLVRESIKVYINTDQQIDK